MARVRQFLSFTLLLFSLQGAAQYCIIKGVASDYSGKHLPVYTISNPIKNNPVPLDTIHCGEDGTFKLHIPVDGLDVIYFDLGRFTGYLYAESGYEYELLLPPYIEKTHQNKINPYYRQVEAHLKVTSSMIVAQGSPVPQELEMNNILFRFDTTVSKFNEEIMMNRMNKTYQDADSIIRMLEAEFKTFDSPYFERFRKYRYGLLKINEGKTGLAELSSNFLSDPVPRIHEPAYMDLFNAMFDDFLVYYARTGEGSNVSNAINRKQSLSDLRNEIRKHPAISSDTIADLVILKEISQQYYENTFIKDALLIILDSLASKASFDPYRTLAGELFEAFSRLMIGNFPPDFSLRDQNGIVRSLDDFKGKYLYLYFCTPDNYSCMTEYPFLNSFHQKHGDYLEVVTVMVAEEYKDMVNFMNQNHYLWTTLYYNDQPDILNAFNVKIFPTAFLVNPDGKLVQSPATLPSEGFQQQLFRIMRSRGEI